MKKLLIITALSLIGMKAYGYQDIYCPATLTCHGYASCQPPAPWKMHYPPYQPPRISPPPTFTVPFTTTDISRQALCAYNMGKLGSVTIYYSSGSLWADWTAAGNAWAYHIPYTNYCKVGGNPKVCPYAL